MKTVNKGMLEASTTSVGLKGHIGIAKPSILLNLPRSPNLRCRISSLGY